MSGPTIAKVEGRHRTAGGNAATAVPDTAELSAHATQLGCAAVMVLPSFFYPATGEDGQARYFSEVIERVSCASSHASWAVRKSASEW